MKFSNRHCAQLLCRLLPGPIDLGILAGKSGFGAIILLLPKPGVVGFGAKIFYPWVQMGRPVNCGTIPELVGFDC